MYICTSKQTAYCFRTTHITDMIEIDKGVPLTPRKLGKDGITDKLVLQMEVGDSFFFSCPEKNNETETRIMLYNKIRQPLRKKRLAKYYDLDRSHAIRKVDGGFRVWRTK